MVGALHRAVTAWLVSCMLVKRRIVQYLAVRRLRGPDAILTDFKQFQKHCVSEECRVFCR